MIIYFAKFILCSGLLFLAYILLFDKEKALQFKRFYLLISLLLSLTIPLITFESSAPIILKGTESYLNIYSENPVKIATVEINQPQKSNIYPSLILAIYIGTSLVLLSRFGRNFYKILAQKKGKVKAAYHRTPVILIENISTPYSFLNYIFVNKTEFEQKQIAEEILLHELTHVRQKHSLDVIFIELLHVFLWFNPILYFYRKAIQTNHEYLADENVIQTSKDIPTYQMLLLKHISTQCGLTLTSQFNYLTIKKRLTMMSKTNSLKAVLGKQLLLIPVLGIALFLFSTKTEAQTQEKSPIKPKQSITTDGLSAAEQQEFNQLYSKYHPETKTEKLTQIKIEGKDVKRLGELYKLMNKEQKNASNLFLFDLKPLKSGPPSNIQLADWKNSKKYGVWIDGKRVKNDDLSNYKESDFGLWISSKLSKNAINYGKHYFQIDLMTNSKYQAYYKEAMGKNNLQAFFVHRK